MSFKDPEKIMACLSQMVNSDIPRSANRARINILFNGEAPYTASEAEQNQIDTNVNFLEGTEVIANAREQYSNAFLKPANFFSVNVDWGPPHKRVEYGNIITKEINRVMKRSSKYFNMLENTFAGVVLHGVGPRVWTKDSDWCPKAKGVDEVLVPARTYTDLSNLTHFAIRTSFTIADLIKRSEGNGSKVGWKMENVNGVIESLRQQGMTQTIGGGYNPYQNLESWEEDIKENGGFWASDAVPVVGCFDFYYQDTDSNDDPVWKRKIMIDTTSSQTPAAFNNVKDPTLFAPSYDYGTDLSQIMHVQFANGANKAPFRWHSVRSLGYMLYALCHLQNRLRCRLNDAVFESMLWFFYDMNQGDGERLRRVDLHNRGVIPEGLKWVPQNERHTVDYNLVSGALQMHQQMIAQRASNFTQDVSDNTQKEMTATEAAARISSASAMVGAMLSRSYAYEASACREVARRFAKIGHKECRTFRDKCEKQGVPKECWQYFDDWEIVVERTLGNGNKALELLQANQLRAIKNDAEISPDARRLIDRMYVTSVTDNPQLADAIVPMDANPPSDAQMWATVSWGTLMAVQPVVITAPISRVEFIKTLLVLLARDLQMVNGSGENPEMEHIAGLANVIQFIQTQIQMIATDEGIADTVRKFEDALGQASNMVKAFFQRAQQESGEGQGGDPETAAKVQAMVIQAQAKARVTEESGAQKRRLKEMQFEQDQGRKNAGVAAQIQRDGAKQSVALSGEIAKSQQQIRSQGVKDAQSVGQAALDHAQELDQAQDIHHQDLANQAVTAAMELASTAKTDDKSKDGG